MWLLFSHSRTITVQMQICHVAVLNYFQQLASNDQFHMMEIRIQRLQKTDYRIPFELVSVLYAINILRQFIPSIANVFYKLRLETTFNSSVPTLSHVVIEEGVPKMK